MNSLLNKMTNDFLISMKKKESVLGAWNFGSAIHGLDDEYSDADLIFLIDGRTFKEINDNIITFYSKTKTVTCYAVWMSGRFSNER